MPLSLREAVPADAARLVELVDALSASEGRPRGRFTLDRALTDGFGPDAQFRVLLAELDQRTVGYALFEPSYSTDWAQRGLHIHDLYVEPSARGRGIGRGLVAAVAAAARADGRTFVWWTSQPHNDTANRLYAGLADIHEPMMAHALAFDAFTKLADEHETRTGGQG